jgi:hypothetical protein
MNSYVKLVVNLLFYLIRFIDGLGDLQIENLRFPTSPVADGQLRFHVEKVRNLLNKDRRFTCEELAEVLVFMLGQFIQF